MNESEQMRFFHEVFDSSLLRLGPGTDASTRRALDIVRSAGPRCAAGADGAGLSNPPPESCLDLGATSSLPAHAPADEPPVAPDGTSTPVPWGEGLRILDLGCGTGAQTLVLARHLRGTILAVDNHPPYLDALRRRAAAAGVSANIVTRAADMRTLAFEEGAFDVIWSEGALYCMGFREGLAACRPWLARDGFLAATELCWLRADIPPGCRRFLEGEYPAVADIEANLSAMRACGYTVLEHFVLPESAWTDEYYDPLEERLRMLRGRYAGDAERSDMIELIQTEIDNYRKYPACYGYVFYVLRR